MKNAKLNHPILDGNHVLLKKNEYFSLRQTLSCGQIFRYWETAPNEYLLIASNRVLELAETDQWIVFKNISLSDFMDQWQEYFDLNTDYSEINRCLSRDPHLTAAAHSARGIHILQQEPWETLCSFIISQNNNIPRIKKIIENLCVQLGEPILDQPAAARKPLFAFPTPQAVLAAGQEALFAMKTGFRAKYLYDAATKVSAGEIDLTALRRLDSMRALADLTKIKGVGPKVASCVLLFGLGKKEAFPVDVWVKRALEHYYPEGTAPDKLGPFAGVAQQYLYYYAREQAGKHA